MHMGRTDILHAYRHLYRSGLRAVHYSYPARWEIRDILRDCFRSQPEAAFNARRISNTLGFLEKARVYNGTEHKILKNLLHVKFWKNKGLNHYLMKQSNADYAIATRRNVWRQYQATLTMLNESLDICLQLGADIK
ncbi:uncharacterized protein PV06_10125 [Exophiala oligosperma]|uniref:Uncharacterized protein n=1 Tax=Exophiala oligosperma TaxID=215243 RepID=A0A0D2AD90_9EURO|nr:uncharacterized protein PV06_10125 [Exophiala oligosperma]KIW38176.1 hypothetical protein PV06_10125 [Exophiala oligosperma]